MGISPISTLTQLPQSRSIGSELEPPPMERVENSARTGDETYSPSNGKSAGGSEDDSPEDGSSENEVVAQPDEAESDSSARVPAASSQISLFA